MYLCYFGPISAKRRKEQKAKTRKKGKQKERKRKEIYNIK